MENKGFVVITGEIGSGKTTLINLLLRKIQPGLKVGLINNTNVGPGQLIKLVCEEFGVKARGHNKATCLSLFRNFLLSQYQKRHRVMLIVDEAQNLYPKALEELRMLSNYSSDKQHLIQIILVGQPELHKKLRRADLEQFTQRVSVHCHLKRLDEREVGPYITHRLNVGGAEKANIFNPKAIQTVGQYADGNPRILNILCDTALVFGYADSARVIDEKIIEKVIAERERGKIFSKTNLKNKKTFSGYSKKSSIKLSELKFVSITDKNLIRIESTLDKIEQHLKKLANN
jgi:general secretion pathway protein A